MIRCARSLLPTRYARFLLGWQTRSTRALPGLFSLTDVETSVRLGKPHSFRHPRAPSSTKAGRCSNPVRTMDASAHLTRLGWRGTGHPLHPTGRGLSRPLLVSKKSDCLGVGKKKHDFADQWWSRALDASLTGLVVSDTANTTAIISDETRQGDRETHGQEVRVCQTDEMGGLQMVAQGGGRWIGVRGLYDHFRRGEELSGTITPESVAPLEQASSGGQGQLSKDKKCGGEMPVSHLAGQKKTRRKRSEQNPEANVTTKAPSTDLAAESVVRVTASQSERKERKAQRRKQKNEARAARLDHHHVDAGVRKETKRKKDRQKNLPLQ